jgi:hypothetical protein
MNTVWIQFDADGPYSFRSAVSKGNVTTKGLKSWFTSHAAGVGAHRGVYFVASGMKKLKPWYVGLATKQTFREECTTPDKIRKINLALGEIGKGEPALLFLKLANGGKKATKVHSKAIDSLETEMIQWCFGRNANLVNNRKKMPAVASFVPGALRTGPGKPAVAATRFKSLLGE